jgi:hypothetical protein
MLLLSALRSGTGPPPPSAARSYPTTRHHLHLGLPVVAVTTTIGSEHHKCRTSSFAPWVLPHAPLRARMVLAATLSALTPIMNLNHVVDVPQLAKGWIVLLSRVHGTSDASRAPVQVCQKCLVIQFACHSDV